MEKSDKDIRTALNSLQYLSNIKEVSIAKLEHANIGSKDHNKSLFEIWREFFKLKNIKNYRNKLILGQNASKLGAGGDAPGANAGSSKNKNLKHALDILQKSGESNYDKILSGLHENFLFSGKTDANFVNLRKISNNLTRFDLRWALLSFSVGNFDQK